jgi:DNA-binding response OmpR family regulator
VTDGEGTLVVIEDDPNISDLIAMYLRRDGFRVLQAEDGESGLSLVEREGPKLVIVDIGLPGRLDGFDVCRKLRSAVPAGGRAGRPSGTGPADGATPLLILSARDDEVDRVLGFELGADDYVTKPFSARELVARVRAIIRRSEAGQREAGWMPTVVALGSIEVDTGRREVRLAGAVVPLATREFDLLAYLVANEGLALSRRQLLNGVWGPDWYGDERTVDVHVRQLRKKLGDDLPLATVWGVGYRLG